ncbi:uncharacterized protein LAESUDRAFT_489445 [Laetiporus sulphureus 93-53]|uniref:Uncharacterized protein n=1 Tax=Laetiporus sulphureus 93-53 TaxID=1314785 RepID=A0A165BK71_9APHY|nr:uncharacterized protein LAESUDRAFT_489445 [Laetiporus sulphureus 93-53]KZT01210.1 hypothetical protein LAESUDRAFT_489445 [Laetiporus sulphureus 93-53]
MQAVHVGLAFSTINGRFSHKGVNAAVPIRIFLRHGEKRPFFWPIRRPFACLRLPASRRRQLSLSQLLWPGDSSTSENVAETTPPPRYAQQAIHMCARLRSQRWLPERRKSTVLLEAQRRDPMANLRRHHQQAIATLHVHAAADNNACQLHRS